MEGIYREISVVDRRKYSAGADSKLNFIYDCGRFLLEGKLSGDAESASRHAVKTDSPGSNLLELCQGLAAMRGGMNAPNVKSAHWATARDPLDSMSMATVMLLGPDAPPLTGDYTPHAVNVLNAMRNCGIAAPPPDTYYLEQSGKGAFNRPALEFAQTELEEMLTEVKTMSEDYPGFTNETVADLNRATFVFNDKSFNNEPKIWVAEAFREFCVDSHGNPDARLLDVVAKLAYQRSNTLALGRLSAGMGIVESDTVPC